MKSLLFVVLLLGPCAVLGQKGGYNRGASRGPASPARAIQQQPSFQPLPAAPARPAPPPLQQVQQEYEEEDQSAVLAPVPSRPASAGGDEEEFGGHPAPEPYSFSYAVNDEESGAEVSREESQDAAGNIVGFYHLRDRDGRLRRVDYTAGPEGFKATVRSNEEGVADKDSADVRYEVEAPTAEQQAQAAALAAAQASRPQGGPASGGATGAAGPQFALAGNLRNKPSSAYSPAFSQQNVDDEQEEQHILQQPAAPALPAQRPSYRPPAKAPQRPAFQPQRPAFQPAPAPAAPRPAPPAFRPQAPAKVPQRPAFQPQRPAPAPAPAAPRPAPPAFRPQAPAKAPQRPAFQPAPAAPRPAPPAFRPQRPAFQPAPAPAAPRPLPARPLPALEQEQIQQEYEPEEISQQQIQQHAKRAALPVNFFLPQAYRS